MPGYLTKHESIAVGGVDDLTIRSLLDRQQFHDPDGEAERQGISSATWPLFGLLWPSGALLATRLALRPVRAGERILEIGCGLGLASLVAHRRGADITASDNHPLAQAFMVENLRLNALAPMKYRHGAWSTGSPRLRGRTATGTARIVRGRFDLLIGSDLLYERDEAGALAGFIGRHAKPGAEVWIVDPDRGNRASFNRKMDTLGYSRTETRIAELPDGGSYKGRLLQYLRKPAI